MTYHPAVHAYAALLGLPGDPLALAFAARLRAYRLGVAA